MRNSTRPARGTAQSLSKNYKDLYDSAPVGYCTISKTGLILEANLTAARLLGESRGTLLKEPFIRFVLSEDQSNFDHRRLEFMQSRSTDGTRACELRMVKRDNTVWWCRLEGRGAVAENGAPVCHIVLSDITQHKQAEENAEETSEQLPFETLLAELWAKLINLPGEEIDRQIEDAQRQVCESLGLELSSLWQWRPDNPSLLRLTHLYRPVSAAGRSTGPGSYGFTRIFSLVSGAGAGRENRDCLFDG